MNDYIILALGLLLLILAVAVIRCGSILGSIILMSAFSITTAVCFVMVAALDVAITEAIVGAGFVTALYLVALSKARDVM